MTLVMEAGAVDFEGDSVIAVDAHAVVLEGAVTAVGGREEIEAGVAVAVKERKASGCL